MKKLLMTATTATLLMFTPAIASANEVGADNPQKIAELVKTWAQDVEVTKDDGGDPKITFKYLDIRQQVLFYGCKQGKNCKSIQFVVGWNNDGKQTLETVNKWNQSKRYVKAFLDKDNDLILQMDVDLEEKVSAAYLKDVMKTWQMSLVAFGMGL